MKMTDKMKRAIKFADQAHGVQTYGKDKPYSYHYMGVMQMTDTIIDAFKIHFWNDAEQENVRIAAILHDVVEDTQAEILDIAIQFGKDVAKMVQQLTHQPEDSYLDYLLKIEGVDAIVIKLADLRFNIAETESQELIDRVSKQRKAKYELAEYILVKKLKRNYCNGRY